jgi:hypothetical protein
VLLLLLQDQEQTPLAQLQTQVQAPHQRTSVLAGEPQLPPQLAAAWPAAVAAVAVAELLQKVLLQVTGHHSPEILLVLPQLQPEPAVAPPAAAAAVVVLRQQRQLAELPPLLQQPLLLPLPTAVVAAAAVVAVPVPAVRQLAVPVAVPELQQPVQQPLQLGAASDAGPPPLISPMDSRYGFHSAAVQLA